MRTLEQIELFSSWRCLRTCFPRKVWSAFDMFFWFLVDTWSCMKCFRVELNTLMVLLLEPKQTNERLNKIVSHMNSVKWPCPPQVLIAQKTECPSVACEQAPVGDSRVQSRAKTGWTDSGLVRRECAEERADIPLMPPFHDISSWYQDLIGWIDDCWQLWDK